MSQISFIPPFAYVLEIRQEPSADFSLVRISTRRPTMAHEAEGARALLHVPRNMASGRYLGCAVIDTLEANPSGTGLFVFLEKIELFERRLATLRAGQPREDGPLDPQGRLKFSFYSEGLRPISEARLLDILDTGGERRLQLGLAETATQANDTQQVPHADDPIREETTRRVRAKLRRSVIRELGAFCCLSGASMNIPGGFSILALSHFRPLGHGGPDTLTNVGLKIPNIHAIWENGLVTLRAHHSLRFAPDIPPGFHAEFKGRTQAILSDDVRFMPLSENLEYHRREVFERRLRANGLPLATTDSHSVHYGAQPMRV